MNTEQLEKALMATIVARQPTFIWGPGGIGKSDVVHQVSAKYGAAMEDNAMEYEINMRIEVPFLWIITHTLSMSELRKWTLPMYVDCLR